MPGTDLAVTTAGALALRPDQTDWTDDQLAVLRHIGTEKATLADLKVFLHRCQQLRLDPFAGQIHLVDYGGKPTIQVGIHGLESTAQTTADESGETLEWEDTTWCGPDGQWSEVWLGDGPPHAARAVVIRGGRRHAAVTLYTEFVGLKKKYDRPGPGGKWTGEWEVNAQWTKRPAWMLGKCAAAAALRRAFPRQLADVREPAELGERPDLLTGEIVREDPPPAAEPLEHWLGLVESATTRAELEQIWRQAEPQLPVADRARLLRACQAAAQTIDAAGDHADREQTLVAVQQLMEECGWIEQADQARLASQILDGMSIADWTELPVHMLTQIADQLRAAVATGDPQAWLQDHTTTTLEETP